MTEKREVVPENPSRDRPSASDIYGVLTSLVMHSEQTRWIRVNALLVVDSIFVAAWAGIFVGTTPFAGKEWLLLLLMCARLCARNRLRGSRLAVQSIHGRLSRLSARSRAAVSERPPSTFSRERGTTSDATKRSVPLHVLKVLGHLYSAGILCSLCLPRYDSVSTAVLQAMTPNHAFERMRRHQASLVEVMTRRPCPLVANYSGAAQRDR